MNRKLKGLSRRYQAALRNYLKQGPRASLPGAQRLGRQALSLGVATLDLARIHEQALIAQTLTSINLRLGALKKQAGLGAIGLDRSIARTQELVKRSVSIVHQFARELRPTVLDDLGLIPALHTFMKSYLRETGIRVSLSAFAAVEQVDGDKRTVLYRVAQEALTNVARHAQASQVEVKIQKLDGAVCMAIKDDGKGFQDQRGLDVKKSTRLGLLGMRERLQMVGGTFSVTSAPGKGTTVLARIPLNKRTLGRKPR
jgi:signal transduction histidine kinase